MQPGYPPVSPQPAPASRKSGAVATIAGWLLLIFGGLIAVAGLAAGPGILGRIAMLLIGVAIAIVGAMLIWRFTSWKRAAPAAVLALIVGAVAMPTVEQPAPAAPLVGPTTSAVVPAAETTSTSATSTSATTTSAASSTASSTTTTSVEATTSTTVDVPNPAVTETRTRTPLPTAPEVTTTTPAPVPTVPDEQGSVYFGSCKQAKAAGAAPLYRGSPGYSSRLDRDGDGVACES